LKIAWDHDRQSAVGIVCCDMHCRANNAQDFVQNMSHGRKISSCQTACPEFLSEPMFQTTLKLQCHSCNAEIAVGCAGELTFSSLAHHMRDRPYMCINPIYLMLCDTPELQLISAKGVLRNNYLPGNQASILRSSRQCFLFDIVNLFKFLCLFSVIFIVRFSPRSSQLCTSCCVAT